MTIIVSGNQMNTKLVEDAYHAMFIFLDIDGVLNNRTSMFLADKGLYAPNNRTYDSMDVGCVRLFEYLVKTTNSKFVISSSWRKKTKQESIHVFDALELCGFKDAYDYCVGVTPKLSTGRGSEIESWLSNRKVDNYVILDDDSFDIHQVDHLVKTEHEIGLTVNDMLKAMKILNFHTNDE